jgi:hypothetical protein
VVARELYNIFLLYLIITIREIHKIFWVYVILLVFKPVFITIVLSDDIVEYGCSGWYPNLISYFVECTNFKDRKTFFQNSQKPLNTVSKDSMAMVKQLHIVLWTPTTTSKFLQMVPNPSVRCKKELGVAIATIN